VKRKEANIKTKFKLYFWKLYSSIPKMKFLKSPQKVGEVPRLNKCLQCTRP
jgi:hypothetical protein